MRGRCNTELQALEDCSDLFCQRFNVAGTRNCKRQHLSASGSSLVVADIAKWNDEDVHVGTVREQEWSGLVTPAGKSALLNKVDVLSRAVRRARSRANDVEVDTSKKIGKDLLKYIFG